MKRLFLLFLCLSTWMVYGQKSGSDSIPAAVQASYQKEYPDAKLKGWEKSKGNYVASTKIEGQNAKATFSPTGEWIETNFETSEKELPGRISNYMANNYGQYKISTSTYTESKNNGAFYYLQIKKEGIGQEPMAEFYFDVSGNFMKKNEFHPITEAISSSSGLEKSRKEAEEKEKKEQQEKREALLKMDRSVSEAELPIPVNNSFKKKYAKAEEVRWDTLDNIYTAHYVLNEIPTTTDFNPKGDWLASTEDIPEDQLFKPVQESIDKDYPQLKFKSSQKTTRRDRSTSYYVELTNRPKRGEEAAITKLYFDKNGRLEKAIEPKKAEEPETEVATNENEPDKFDQKLDQEEASGKTVKEGAKISGQELPSPIIKYVQDYYPGYKIKEAYFDEFEDLGLCYKVIVKREGLKQPSNEIFFDDKGKLLKETNPPPKKPESQAKKTTHEESKPQKQGVKKSDQAFSDEDVVEVKSKDTKKTTVKPTAKTTTSKAKSKKQAKEEEAEVEEADKPEKADFAEISDSDVPDLVKKSFKKRFPKAEDPVWSTDDSTHQVEFKMMEVKNVVQFNKAGVVMVTKTEMDAGTLMGPIQRYLDEKYSGYKVRYAEKVLRKDRKNYFYLELYTKKKSLNPKEVQVYFDKSGRFMENPPE